VSKSLEKIVRPFQLDDPFTSRLPPPPPDPSVNPPEDVVLTITSRADTEYIEEPPPVALGFQAEWTEDRSKRVTETVRVENPDDSEQHVDIERIKAASFRNTKTGEQLNIKTDWS
jgi:hypothetical protein